MLSAAGNLLSAAGNMHMFMLPVTCACTCTCTCCLLIKCGGQLGPCGMLNAAGCKLRVGLLVSPHWTLGLAAGPRARGLLVGRWARGGLASLVRSVSCVWSLCVPCMTGLRTCPRSVLWAHTVM